MDEQLEYLTIQSLSWSKGYQRPRMDATTRRERHRVVQRRFVARKRERVGELNDIIRLLELQVKWLRAAQAARDQARENDTLRLRLQVLETSVEPLRYEEGASDDHGIDDLWVAVSAINERTDPVLGHSMPLLPIASVSECPI